MFMCICRILLKVYLLAYLQCSHANNHDLQSTELLFSFIVNISMLQPNLFGEIFFLAVKTKTPP